MYLSLWYFTWPRTLLHRRHIHLHHRLWVVPPGKSFQTSLTITRTFRLTKWQNIYCDLTHPAVRLWWFYFILFSSQIMRSALMNRAGKVYNNISPKLTLFVSFAAAPYYLPYLVVVSILLLRMSTDALRQLVAVESMTLALSFVCRIHFPNQPKSTKTYSLRLVVYSC